MKDFTILTMNFGSTSTKVAVFDGDTCQHVEIFRHDPKDMAGFQTMEDDANFRKPIITNWLQEIGMELCEFDAIVGRGGLVRPLCGGTYAVNEAMLEDLHSCAYGKHVCNLGGILAAELTHDLGIPAFVVDPPVIDEMSSLAKLSGHPDHPRRPLFHALNQKAIAKRFAHEIDIPYDSLRLIVCHMGGGITVGAHRNGRIVDVNNGLEGEGAYTAERSGSLPVLDVLRIAFSGKYGTTYEELRRHFSFECGLQGYTGSNNGIEIHQRMKSGDSKAERAYRGMAYQVSKEISAMGAVLQGRVDAILLTGGFAHDKTLMRWIEENVRFLAPVYIYPGEDEMLSMAQGAIRVLSGEEKVQVYK